MNTPFDKDLTIQEIDAKINDLQEQRKKAVAKQFKGRTMGMVYVFAQSAASAEIYMRYLGRQRNEWKFVSSPEYLRGLRQYTLMIVGDCRHVKGYSAVIHETRLREGVLLFLNDRE